MCLVSYIPLSGNEYCITSNRDEAPTRAAYQIQEDTVADQKVYYPADTLGGSWIVCSENKRSVCLLNGAFIRHERQLPYRMSRGIMMKEFFKFSNAVDFLEGFDFRRIEPFTMVIAEPLYLFEFRWDSEIKHIKTLQRDQTYVWSSSTLYDVDAIEKRQDWFNEELDKVDNLSPELIVNIHKAGGAKDRSIGFLMNWEDRVRTISISQIHSADQSQLLHIPLEDTSIEPLSKTIYG